MSIFYSFPKSDILKQNLLEECLNSTVGKNRISVELLNPRVSFARKRTNKSKNKILENAFKDKKSEFRFVKRSFGDGIFYYDVVVATTIKEKVYFVFILLDNDVAQELIRKYKLKKKF